MKDLEAAPAYPVVTECPGCQSFADARALFVAVEAIAIKHDLHPDRVARALTALVGLWTSVAEGVKDDRADIDTVVGDTLSATEYVLRSYMDPDDAPAGHRH